ncbi:uncharacterized protein LOC142171975 [Nicotiana tabacum]|uniref:Uncharacterized protein LOC142171975 n=1 Tax=Nicotiana tabacum TaxID=4097 RepID=A0AC58T3K8_TOBAC
MISFSAQFNLSISTPKLDCSSTIPVAYPSRVGVTVVDQHHPIVLQPPDTPGISLISIKLTGHENYALWSSSMRISLLGKNKLGFVDGRNTKEKFDTSLYDLWEKYNAIVLSWIINSVSIELLSGMVYATSAHKGISSVSSYFSKLKEFWTEFDALMPCPGYGCEESKRYVKHFEYQRLLQSLMGLNKSYAQSSNQILNMSPIPSINKDYSMIISEESRRFLADHTSNVPNLTNNQLAQVAASGIPQFTYEQYNQIMQMLGKGNENSGLPMTTGMAHHFKVGKLCLPTRDVATVKHIGSTYIFSGHKITNDLFGGQVKNIGKEGSGLYVLTSKSIIKAIDSTSTTSNSSLFPRSLTIDDTGQHCTVCPVAKQTRLPFSLSTLTAHSNFDIIHANVWGPYRVPTYGGKSVSHSPTVEQSIEPSVDSLASTEVLNSSTASDTSTPFAEIPAETSAPVLPTEASKPSRKSLRVSKPPLWMKYYVLPTQGKSNCCYPLSNYVSYDNISSAYSSSLSAYLAIIEPKFCNEIVQNPKWIAFMKSGITALEENKTWSIVDLPDGKVPIGCKWVFKVKYTALEKVKRYKTRLVAKGSCPQLILQTRCDLQCLKFKMKDLGELKFFLGIKFVRSRKGIVMNQRKYALELIAELGLGRAEPADASLEPNQKLTSTNYDDFINSQSTRNT